VYVPAGGKLRNVIIGLLLKKNGSIQICWTDMWVYKMNLNISPPYGEIGLPVTRDHLQSLMFFKTRRFPFTGVLPV
jgi:hypothetical protein